LMGEHAFDVSIFPNPAVEIINVNVLNADIEDVEISIYNSNGALMHTQRLNQAPNNLNVHIDLADFHVGIYQVVVRTSDHVSSKMFFKN